MKKKTIFICNNCGAISPKWMGKCSDCNSWNTIEEQIQEKGSLKNSYKAVEATAISDLIITKENRILTGIDELDITLGGGIVRGSLVLVGGDPGIGKSTLLLQMSSNLSDKGKKVLYISGEESASQIKMRATRLGVEGNNILLVSHTNLETIISTIDKYSPEIVIIDSISTTTTDDLTATAGSVSQVKEVCSRLLNISKTRSITTFLVGHVTKSGNIAGPKVLEHMVDTVLYFEGDSSSLHRILRSVKNRFGSTNELGLFSMTSSGLTQVKNPSELFLSGSNGEAGTVVFALVEGTRPLLVEIQSLVSYTNFPSPRRMAIGVDYNSVIFSCAILEKKRGFNLQNQDIYVNAVGGIDIQEPAISLAVITSIASSILSIPVDNKTVIMGEVGLLGEIRQIVQINSRLQEAKRLGYKRAIIPNQKTDVKGIEIIKLKSIDELFFKLFSKSEVKRRKEY